MLNRFRPQLESLDDRIVPSAPGGGGGGPPPTPDGSTFIWQPGGTTQIQYDHAANDWTVDGGVPSRVPNSTDKIVLPSGTAPIGFAAGTSLDAIETDGYSQTAAAAGNLILKGVTHSSEWSSGTLTVPHGCTLETETAASFNWNGGRIETSGSGSIANLDIHGVGHVDGTLHSGVRINVYGDVDASAAIYTVVAGADIVVKDGGNLDASFALQSDSYSNIASLRVEAVGVVTFEGNTSVKYGGFDNAGVAELAAGKTLTLQGYVTGATSFNQHGNGYCYFTMNAGAEIASYGESIVGKSTQLYVTGSGSHTFSHTTDWYFKGAQLNCGTGADMTFTATSGYSTVHFQNDGTTASIWSTVLDYTNNHMNAMSVGKVVSDSGTILTVTAYGTPATGVWKIFDASQTGSTAPDVLILPTGCTTNWLQEDWRIAH